MKNVSKEMQLKKAYSRLNDVNKNIISSNTTLRKQILKKAMESDLPLYKDKELLKNLSDAELNNNFKDKYYPAAADIVSYINQYNSTKVASDA